MRPADLADQSFWADRLGLSAIPLDQGDRRRFVMLNGSRGNFCLDFDEERPLSPRSHAWSADVGHYVHIAGDNVSVYRWDRNPLDVRRYDRRELTDKLPQFHQLLERNDPSREKSIVRFTMDLFRTIRAEFGPEQVVGESLQVFLVLLACGLAKTERADLDPNDWGLPGTALDAANRISSDKWRGLTNMLESGKVSEDLRPEIDLMLRHAAGQVFQEAHYFAESPPMALPFSELLQQPLAPAVHTASSPGVYFTPPYLARTLVEQALNHISLPAHRKITIFDPACGSGAILGQAVRELERRNYQGAIELIGWDRSLLSCQIAQFILRFEQRRSPLKITFTIRNCDSDADISTWPHTDALIMNPPFISYEGLTTEQRARIQKALGQMAGQRPDLSSLFLFAGLKCVTEGGTLASIIPSSFLDNASTVGLRGYIHQHASPTLLAKLGDMNIFRNALIDSGMIVAHKGQAEGKMLWCSPSGSVVPLALRRLRQYDGSRNKEVIAPPMFSIYPIVPPLEDDSWAPRPYDSLELFTSCRRNSVVGDLFHVHQGVRTGNRAAFILRDDAFRKLPRSEQKYFRDTVVNRSLQDGRITNTVHMFYPYGDYEIPTEEELAKRLKTYCHRYLLPIRDVLKRRKKIDPDRWWELTWPRKDIIAPKIISTDFGGKGSFAFDDAGDRLVTSGYYWVWKKGKLPADLGLAYIAMLNSAMFEVLLGATSRQVSGGQWYLQSRFVEPLPIPNLAAKTFPADVLDGLIDIGKAIHDGVTVRKDWETIVRVAYVFGERDTDLRGIDAAAQP